MEGNVELPVERYDAMHWIRLALGLLVVGLGIYAAVKPKSKVRQEADQICEAMQKALSKIRIG